MPPSRRRPPPSPGQVPPVRRPRVAGLRNRPAAPQTEPETEPQSESGTLDIEDTGQDASPEPEPTEPTVSRAGSIGAEPEAPAAEYDDFGDFDDHDEDQVDQDDAAPAPTPRSRPAGKRRATGTTRPENLREAESRTRSASVRRVAEENPRKRGANQLSVAIVLVVVAVVLAGLAIWFRGEATGLRSADDNTALTDAAATSEAVGQLKSAIEQTFSYNYTDLESTQQAVDETLTGKARCEYDQLFGQVRKLAPKQKIVMVTAVRDIALVRLDGDRAQALVFIDQSSTRVDVNNSVAGEAQFEVVARRDGDRWKITEFDMFDQPLVNGQPAPKC